MLLHKGELQWNTDVGLDVGLEETSLCIVDSEGKTIWEVKVSTSQRRSAPLLKASRIASRASKERMEPRLENANSVRVDGRTLPAVSAERKVMPMSEKLQNNVVES